MNSILPSRLLRWSLYTGLFFLLLMTILRQVFFFVLRHLHLSWIDALPSFGLGLRYDLRMICVLMMVLILVGSIRPFNPYESKRAKIAWFGILGIVSFLFCFFYIVDFLHYEYLSQRLNASVLNFVKDAGISMTMV